jgi:hypothetical protein
VADWSGREGGETLFDLDAPGEVFLDGFYRKFSPHGFGNRSSPYLTSTVNEDARELFLHFHPLLQHTTPVAPGMTVRGQSSLDRELLMEPT